MPNKDSTEKIAIRPLVPEDLPSVIAIIESVYKDYNYKMDFEHFDSDLADIDTTYREHGGEFWVAEQGGTVLGCVGIIPHESDCCELKRLYVARSSRRRGIGTRLLSTARGWAITRGFRRMILWSDVLLTAAHELYTKSGFRATSETRAIDPTNPTSVERRFEIEL